MIPARPMRNSRGFHWTTAITMMASSTSPNQLKYMSARLAQGLANSNPGPKSNPMRQMLTGPHPTSTLKVKMRSSERVASSIQVTASQPTDLGISNILLLSLSNGPYHARWVSADDSCRQRARRPPSRAYGGYKAPENYSGTGGAASDTLRLPLLDTSWQPRTHFQARQPKNCAIAAAFDYKHTSNPVPLSAAPRCCG